MTARLDVTPKTTEQNRIVCTSKSEAKVTNNKKTALEVLYYWRNEASYTDRHEASRGLFATAELLVYTEVMWHYSWLIHSLIMDYNTLRRLFLSYRCFTDVLHRCDVIQGWPEVSDVVSWPGKPDPRPRYHVYEVRRAVQLLGHLERRVAATSQPQHRRTVHLSRKTRLDNSK